MKIGSTLDPESYIIQKPTIEDWIKLKGSEFKYLEEVGYIALSTSLHIVLVSFFIGQIKGFNDELVDKMNRDMKFYNIEEVLGLQREIDSYKERVLNEAR